jgi:hypothetical protein
VTLVFEFGTISLASGDCELEKKPKNRNKNQYKWKIQVDCENIYLRNILNGVYLGLLFKIGDGGFWMVAAFVNREALRGRVRGHEGVVMMQARRGGRRCGKFAMAMGSFFLVR